MNEMLQAKARLFLLSVLILSNGATAMALYHPEEGRWISRDPIEERGGPNLYLFIDNNAVNCADPNGKKKLRQDSYSNNKSDEDTSTDSPVAESTECKIILACHAVSYLDLPTPFDHCYLIVENSFGSSKACRAGPGKRNQGTATIPSHCDKRCCGSFGPIVTECGDYNSSFVDYEQPNNKKKVIAVGQSICNMSACVQDYMRLIGNSC